MTPVRLGTRGSPLALWQARTVAAALRRAGAAACELRVVKTSGDRRSAAANAGGGRQPFVEDGKRLFVKEIEEALLRDDIDVAVHSAKDMPGDLPPGLTIGAVLEREDPRDALVTPAGRPVPSTHSDTLVTSLGHSPRVGTGSVRRIAQLKRLWPHAVCLPIRGNLDTRLRKLDAGGYDVLVLAAAGLKRLGLADRIASALPVDRCLPAPGQGAIALEIRDADERIGALVARCADTHATASVTAERALVAGLGGDCQTPIGAIARFADAELELRAAVFSLDGSRCVTDSRRGRPQDAGALGRRVAEQLLADGADTILAEARRDDPPAAGKTGRW